MTDPDAPASSAITYTWKAAGSTVAVGAGLNTYTPSESDEGKALTLDVSFTDTHGFAEGANGSSAGTVAAIPLTVISAVANPATGDLNAPHTVTISLTMAEAATVTGSPFLTLNDTGQANYTSGSGTNTLVFTYTVGAGQNTSNLAVTGSNLNGGTIKDAEGTAFVLTGANVTFTGLQIDTTAPTVSSVTDTVSGSDLKAGGTVTITLNMSEAVTVTGTPTLTLNDGGSATYNSGTSTTTTLKFDYTVQNTDTNVASLAVATANLPGGATVKDGAGNANLTGADVTLPTAVQIDTKGPTGTSFTLDANASDIAALTLSNKLNTGGTIGTITATGDPDSGDSFSYAIASGFGGNGFAVNSTTGLFTTAANLTGPDFRGFVYTATDTAGNSAGNQILYTWLGTSGNDTVNLGTLIGTNVPIIAYGFSGNDSITTGANSKGV